MSNSILLFRRDEFWMGRYTGPYREHLMKYFGTDEMNTGFFQESAPEGVRYEVQRLNPMFKVILLEGTGG